MTSMFALVVAQSLGEYGGAGGALRDGWNGIQRTVSDLIGDTGTGTWIVIGLVVLLVWFFFRGRR